MTIGIHSYNHWNLFVQRHEPFERRYQSFELQHEPFKRKHQLFQQQYHPFEWRNQPLKLLLNARNFAAELWFERLSQVDQTAAIVTEQ